MYFDISFPILTPNEVMLAIHFMPQGLCRKLEDAAIQIASLLSLFKFEPEHATKCSIIRFKANRSEFSSDR